jgi:hypothetical protein
LRKTDLWISTETSALGCAWRCGLQNAQGEGQLPVLVKPSSARRMNDRLMLALCSFALSANFVDVISALR